jgi:DNA-binding response OmpR family regulator
VGLIHKRILFVDDEPAIRATLAIILRRYGFTVIVASTVGQAIEEIKKQEFDLLLSDLNIEGKRDGYNIVRAMRQANSNCINIVLTGYPDEESAAEGLELGIDDYIAKPANADALVAMLAEKLTGRNKARTE